MITGIRQNRHVKKSDIFIETVLYIIVLFFLFPIFNIFLSSFKTKIDIYNFFAMPNLTYWENYLELFRKVSVFKSFALTLFITAAAIAINILFSSMAGFVISRAKKGFFKGIYFYFMLGIIVPTQSSMAILYKLGVNLHIINTVFFLIILYVCSPAYQIMLYTGFMKTIPVELEESASIDGCNIYSMFIRIIFPLLLPATGTLIITTVFWYWNDFQTPLIYYSGGGGKTDTLIMGIYRFSVSKGGIDMGPVFALVSVTVAPVIAAFIFGQKYMLNGLVVGAIKG